MESLNIMEMQKTKLITRGTTKQMSFTESC